MIDSALRSWQWTASTVNGLIEGARRHIDSLAPVFVGGLVSFFPGAPGILSAPSGGALRRRDFSQARKQELINASRYFSNSEFWELPEHFWLGTQRLANEAYPPAGDFSIAKNYVRGVAQANRHGLQRIEAVFREAYVADSQYADRIHADTQAIRQTSQSLRSIANGIGTMDILPDRRVFA
jgi:hypothetical protein